jgi:hypothetical protein
VRVHLRAIAENQSSGTFVGFKKARGGNHEVSAFGESGLYFADRVPICIFSSPLNVFCLRTRTKYRSQLRNQKTCAGAGNYSLTICNLRAPVFFVQWIDFDPLLFAPLLSLLFAPLLSLSLSAIAVVSTMSQGKCRWGN